MEVSTRFATKDIASMASLTYKLHTYLPDDCSNGFTSDMACSPCYVKDSLALLSRIVIIWKSHYFNMLAS